MFECYNVNPFRAKSAVPFSGASYLKFDWFLPKTGLLFGRVGGVLRRFDFLIFERVGG